MIFSDLKTYVGTVTNRPEILTAQTGEPEARVVTALRASHTSLQQDEFVDRSYGNPVRMKPEFRAQVWEDSGLDYVANGPGILLTTLPQGSTYTLKRITDVKYLTTDGTTNVYVPIDPATPEEVEWYKLSEKDAFHAKQLSRCNYVQRWFTDDGYLQLLFPSGNSNTDLTLFVRLYQMLPFYVNPTDHDEFSDRYWEALTFGAAYRAMIYIGEVDDAKAFKELFEEAAIKAIRTDRTNAQGGQDRNYRPPAPIGRRF